MKAEDHILISGLLDGELTPEQTAALQKRMASDVDLAKGHARVAALKLRLARLPGADVSPVFMQRIDAVVKPAPVAQTTSGNWRQLAVLRRNLVASRLQVRLAARQFDSAVDQANAPAAVGGAGGGQGGVQGNLLVQALNSIISAQNTLISNWVSYEQNRLGIYRDMGMMEIGPDGIWNDPAYRGTSDRDTPEGLPDPQTSPSSGLNDDPQEIVPHLDSAPDLGMSRPVWSGPGGDGPAEGLVQTAHGNGEARLFRADDEGRGEEAVPDQSVSAGNAGQLGELDAD